jgi:hypothetical protein
LNYNKREHNNFQGFFMKTTTIADKKKISKATADHEAVDLSIDSSGLVHIMSLLTDLYSNPREAVLREYVSNAIDSHRRFGVTDKRIEVTVPYFEKSTYGWGDNQAAAGGEKLIVRDYGVGMSKTELVEIYSRYGSSTKRTNNTEIGGFGLGAKSALAIAHRFDIVSIKDGIRVECYIEKNDLGVGVLHFVSETPTKEHSGVTITIPYTAQKTEAELFAFFVGQDDHLLTINGKKFVKTVTNEKYFEAIYGDNPDAPVGWVVKKVLDGVDFITNSETYITIGGVIYDTNNPAFRDIKRNVEFYSRAVIVNVPIGSVDFTPSREDLIYRGRTITSLRQTFASFSDAFTQHMTDSLNFIDNRLDAYEFVYSASADRFWNANKLTWRGEKVPLQFKLDGDAYADELRIKSGTKTKIQSQRASASELYSLVKKNNFILARYTAKSYDGLFAEAEDFGKAMRTLEDVYGIKGAVVIPDDKNWNNPWVKVLQDSRFDSLNLADITAAGKALAAEQRRKDRLANASSAPKPKVRKPVERIVNFDSKIDGAVYDVEQVYTGDKRLDASTIYFVSQRDHTRVHPGNVWFPEGQDVSSVKVDSSGFWELSKRIVKRDKATVILVSSLRSMDKFMEKYPNAVALMPKVKEYAREKFKPNVSVTYAHAMADRTNSRFASYKYNHLGSIYENLKEHGYAGNIHESFVEIASALTTKKINATRTDKDHEYLILEHWSGISPESDPAYKDRIDELQREIVAVSERYFLLSNAGANLKQKWQLEQLVNYINMVAEAESAA